MDKFKVRSAAYWDRAGGKFVTVNGVNSFSLSNSGDLYFVFDEPDSGGNIALLVNHQDWRDLSLNNELI